MIKISCSGRFSNKCQHTVKKDWEACKYCINNEYLNTWDWTLVKDNFEEIKEETPAPVDKEYLDSILIDGCVDTSEAPISTEEFNDKFLEWIEANNWYFGGTVRTYAPENE